MTSQERDNPSGYAGMNAQIALTDRTVQQHLEYSDKNTNWRINIRTWNREDANPE